MLEKQLGHKVDSRTEDAVERCNRTEISVSKVLLDNEERKAENLLDMSILASMSRWQVWRCKLDSSRTFVD